MLNKSSLSKSARILKTIGPGLLFASSAIGTSHLVLSTRAGAHHGMIFIWIILGALILKYPFYEFGPRYANATGQSLVKGYRDQGKWAVILFMTVIFINMFAVTAAVSAVSAGLLSTILGWNSLSVPVISGIILTFTAILLLVGGYRGLDNLIKVISVVLLITVAIAFCSVLIKETSLPVDQFQPKGLLEGAGLALMVSLLGWMPSGIEVSAMQSIWILEKEKTTQYHPTLKECLFDFKLGYGFTTVIALMFLTIGALTVYGSGQVLDGNATQFSQKLLLVFTSNIGPWSYPVIAIAAFGTIYGTLITAWDAFARSFAEGLRIFRFDRIENDSVQNDFLNKRYRVLLVIIGIGGFLLFYLYAGGMIKLLEAATIVAFITAPIVAFLNIRAIQSKVIPGSHKPPGWLIILAYTGLLAMVVFSGYYLMDLVG